eukprot:GDKJ01041560.1.p1 GENE.GDKJ01041560.1~~GDKJ01041560.1.p1  ORF type:complete len:612 (+),score=81.90 GDKJ01041560.1:78-1913(+)
MSCPQAIVAFLFYQILFILVEMILRTLFPSMRSKNVFLPASTIQNINSTFKTPGSTTLQWNPWSEGTNLTYPYSHSLGESRIVSDNGHIFLETDENSIVHLENVWGSSLMMYCAFHVLDKPCLFGFSRVPCVSPELRRKNQHPSCIASLSPYNMCSILTITEIDLNSKTLIQRELFSGVELQRGDPSTIKQDQSASFQKVSLDALVIPHITCISPLSVASQVTKGKNTKLVSQKSDSDDSESAFESSTDPFSASEFVPSVKISFLATHDGKKASNLDSFACIHHLISAPLTSSSSSSTKALVLADHSSARFGICSLLVNNVGSGIAISETGSQIDMTPTDNPIDFIPQIEIPGQQDKRSTRGFNFDDASSTTSSNRGTRQPPPAEESGNNFNRMFNLPSLYSSSRTAPIHQMMAFSVRGVQWHWGAHQMMLLSEVTSGGSVYLRALVMRFPHHITAQNNSSSRNAYVTASMSKFFIHSPTYGISTSLKQQYSFNQPNDLTSSNNSPLSETSNSKIPEEKSSTEGLPSASNDATAEEFFAFSPFSISVVTGDTSTTLSITVSLTNVRAFVRSDHSPQPIVPIWGREPGEAVTNLPNLFHDHQFIKDRKKSKE